MGPKHKEIGAQFLCCADDPFERICKDDVRPSLYAVDRPESRHLLTKQGPRVGRLMVDEPFRPVIIDHVNEIKFGVVCSGNKDGTPEGAV